MSGLSIERARVFGLDGRAHDDAVVLLRITRPAARNALDVATLDRIAEIGSALDPAVRAVVITGTEGTFAAGGDLRELAAVVGEDEVEDFATRGARACRALADLAVPVIAAVNGGAYGGGAELALSCDVRVGDATSVFGFRQARMGVTTGWGTVSTLISLVGAGRARRLVFAADDIGAEKALAFGLLDELAPNGETAEQAALKLAGAIARVSPSAVKAQKKLFRALLAPPAGFVEAERAAFVEAWMGAEHAEAMAAFAERRLPDFLKFRGG